MSMTREQAASFATIIDNGWPGRPLTPETMALYIGAIIDLPYAIVGSTLARLVKSSKFRPSVAELRLMVAESLGLMPLPVDKAVAVASQWVDAMEQAAFANGSGYAPPEPPVMGPVSTRILQELDTTHGSWRSQFRKAYAEAIEGRIAEILQGDISEQAMALGTGA